MILRDIVRMFRNTTAREWIFIIAAATLFYLFSYVLCAWAAM